MTTFTVQTLVAFALSLGMGVVASAQDNGRGCTLKTLRGSYLFAARGFNIVGGVAQPKAILEAIVFSGDGTLTVPAVTVSVNGVIARPPAGLGDYTVLENCTGTIVFTGGPSFDTFIAPDGKTVWMIQTNPNTVFQGTATQIEQS